jgi:hypothetical protein
MLLVSAYRDQYQLEGVQRLGELRRSQVGQDKR